MMTHVPRELCCDESDGACACTSGILSGAGSSKLSLAALAVLAPAPLTAVRADRTCRYSSGGHVRSGWRPPQSLQTLLWRLC